MDLSVIQTELQAKSILKEYGLDFKIEKRALVDMTDVIINPEDDSIQPSKTPYYGLKNMKTGKYIYSCTKGYHVSQNEDVVKLVLKGIRGFGNLSVHKAGSINGGKKTFIQIGIEGMAQVGNDQIKRYITVLDSNDGSSAISMGIGDLTMSCSNQFFKFYGKATNRIYHSSTLEEKLEQLPAIITVSLNESLKMIELYNKFESTVITKDLAERMVEYIADIDLSIPKEEFEKLSSRKVNSIKSLQQHINKEIKSKGLNLWGLHSGVTSWTTHDRSVPRRTHGRIESLMIGSAYKDNQKSIDLCTQIMLKEQMAN